MYKESFLRYLKLERNYSEKTVVSYRTDLDKFEKYLKECDEGAEIENIDCDIIRNWIIHLTDSGYSTSSVNRKISSLRAYYRFLLKKGEIAINPTVKIQGLKKRKKLPNFIRESEMNKLLDETKFEETFEGARDYLILNIFYETGIRLSELITLKDKDIDLDSKTLKVTGKRNKQRYIPFGDNLKDKITKFLDIREKAINNVCEAFFTRKNGKKLYPTLVYRLVRQNLSKVVTVKKRSPHVLRHSFATAMLNNDAKLESVKELLGHESLTTTEIYTHVTFEELKKEYKLAHPRA